MRSGLKIFISLVMGIILYACGSPFKYEDFTNSDSYKTEKAFLEDSKKCVAEKNKHSNKIQGREFGFRGEHTGYLGCMKLKGWSKN
jgi:hypothetical protein